MSTAKLYTILILFFGIHIHSHSQNSLSSDSIQEDLLKAPQLTQIEINNEFVDFTKLNDYDYRRSIDFGNELYETFDSVNTQSNYPLNLNLPYHLNNLTFHYSAIDWSAPHRIRYSYMLEGFDKEWSKPSYQSKVAYQNLTSGQYSFKIRSIGEEQVWSEPMNYSFGIRRPWWSSWWAYAFFALSIFLIGYWMYHTWQEKKSQEAEVRKLLEAYKLTDFPKAIEMKKGIEESSFLKLVQTTLETHLSDENFVIAELCELLNISRAQLHRKLKKLTGLSTSHYIRSLRLEIAKELLVTTNLNISEVAFKVGFSSPTYFSKVFKSQYGHAPSDHQ